MERFIQQYFARVGGVLSDAVRLGLDRLREFLGQHDFKDFADGADFANRVLDEMESAWGNGWASSRAITTINSTTKSIYEYYRLRDITVFGENSPIKLRLGGPDRTSIKFIGELDHFYFSKFADNTRIPMRDFFVKRFFEDGSLLFDQNSTAWRDFQKAGGERFKNLTYRQTKTIIDTATARTRNWAHIGTMHQSEFEYARLVAILDARTTPLCEFLDGKWLRVGVAQKSIERLNQLPPAEFAMELYGSGLNKAIQANPVDTLKQFVEPDGITLSDELTKMGRSFPPFHPNCRTRMVGVTTLEEEKKNEQGSPSQ